MKTSIPSGCSMMFTKSVGCLWGDAGLSPRFRSGKLSKKSVEVLLLCEQERMKEAQLTVAGEYVEPKLRRSCGLAEEEWRRDVEEMKYIST
jgi:hypothetical protein